LSKFYITISSKNKTTIRKFFNFLQKNLSNIENKAILQYKKKKNKKKIINVLKSPHINKSAQEKFQYTIYSITIKIYSFKINKQIILFKKLNNNLFPDIKTKIVTSKNNKKNQKTKIKFLNNNKLLLNVNSIKEKILIKKTSNYLEILDTFGEHNFTSQQKS
jgi:ribosomal protein S10